VVGIGFVPAWFIKLVVLALIWSFLHHLIAGLRHLYMDTHHAVGKEFGRTSALITLGLSWAITLLLAAKLFGIY
jgi:succinate dehydrogenase / fumarate reductase cytochrome b subunit